MFSLLGLLFSLCRLVFSLLGFCLAFCRLVFSLLALVHPSFFRFVSLSGRLSLSIVSFPLTTTTKRNKNWQERKASEFTTSTNLCKDDFNGFFSSIKSREGNSTFLTFAYCSSHGQESAAPVLWQRDAGWAKTLLEYSRLMFSLWTLLFILRRLVFSLLRQSLEP